VNLDEDAICVNYLLVDEVDSYLCELSTSYLCELSTSYLCEVDSYLCELSTSYLCELSTCFMKMLFVDEDAICVNYLLSIIYLWTCGLVDDA
jgi:hypothetical protein